MSSPAGHPEPALRALVSALDFDDPSWPRCLDDLRAERGLAPLALPPQPAAAAWKLLISALDRAEARRLHELRFVWLQTRPAARRMRLVLPSIWLTQLQRWRALIAADIELDGDERSWGWACERLLRWLLLETLACDQALLSTQLGEPRPIKHRAVEVLRRLGDGLWIVRARIQLGCGAHAATARRQLGGEAADAELGALLRDRLALSQRFRPRRRQLPRLLWCDHLDLAVSRIEEAALRDGSRWSGLLLREEPRGEHAAELIKAATLVRPGPRATWEGIPFRAAIFSMDQPDALLGASLRDCLPR